MKKILSLTLVAALAIGFNACKKNAPSVVGTSNTGNTTTTNTTAPPVVTDPLAAVGSLPTNYTKKVVLEEFTGEWCQWCPNGAKAMEDIINANPQTVIGIAVHDGDPMEIVSYNTWIKTLVNVGGFPNGSVDRADATGTSSWSSEVSSELTKVADLGLAMVTKRSGDLVDIKVFVGYKSSIPAGTKLTVAITENKVPQSFPGAQSTNSTTAPLVGPGWTHGHVLRGLVTADEGNTIALNSSKKYTIVEFKGVDLKAMKILNYANAHVAAFINLNNSPRNVLNAQSVGLTETKKWD